MSKRLPQMKTDKAVRNLMATDMSDYISSKNFSAVSFEFEAKDKSITLRVSDQLLKKVQSLAKKRHTPYQKVIRQAIEKFVLEAA
jgi:predicted DNA binding CopG/RHH family protein